MGLITIQEIEDFIEKIPPQSQILQQTTALLTSGELIRASKIAQEDLALRAYLKSMINKPIYGFKEEVSDLTQIFGILGVSMSKQSVYNYQTALLSPKKWSVFTLNAKLFQELQASLSKEWEKILLHLKITTAEYCTSIVLMPASIIVIDALFASKKADVALLRSAKALDYNTILLKLCNTTLFDLCSQIATKWEMGASVNELIRAASGKSRSKNSQINTLAKWMHLLFFYTLSKPEFVQAGLNDFLDFEVEFIGDIYDEFASLMEIQ